MKEIRIPVPLILLAAVGLLIATIVSQLPEIKRYLKVKSME